ncbi:MAG TPA: hypothetical protein VHS09_00325 [Polyangiaceae bacterium]|nr:hypothetical protein [Polyangiaceae bacterium]
MRAWTFGMATRWGALALACGVVASQPSTSAQASSAPRRPFVLAPLATVTPQAEGQHGAGKKGGNFKESVVYVDGAAKGILRYSELPSSIKPSAMPEIDGLDVARYYRLADYLEAIGIDLAKIREMQVYGSHDRIAIITGEEIRTLRAGLVFDFTQQTGGKARARWAQTHVLPHHPMVDVIMNISIYVEKAAPTLAHGDMWLDGKVVDDPIPYVGDGVPKGTRVYADGKLDGWVRRKQLPSKLLAPHSGEAHAKFSTDAFVAWVGADTRNVKAIDFFDGDSFLARVDGKTWAKTKGEYVFELPTRSHGQVRQYFPGDESARVTSLQVYVRNTPPARQPDSAAFEPQGGSDDPQSGGGGAGNGDGSGGNNGVTGVAQGVNNGSATADDDQF